MNLEDFELVQRGSVELISDLSRDALEAPNLDAILPKFADGSPLLWCAVVDLAEPGIGTETLIEGIDWKIAFPTKSFEFERFDYNGEIVHAKLEPPFAFISVPTGEITLTGARDKGRRLVRALLGYLQLRSHLLVSASIAWEGAARRTADGKIATATGQVRTHLEVSEAGVERLRNLLLDFKLQKLEARHRLALEWVAEAWKGDSTPVRLATLWFAVVAAVDSTFSKKNPPYQMDRIKEYLLRLPWSKARQDDIYKAFDRAYYLRNKVVHEGDTAAVTFEDLTALYDAVRQFLLTDVNR